MAHEMAQPKRQAKRKHSEVSVYKEPGKDVYSYRVQIGKKRFKRSTGQTTRAAALAQAKIIAKGLRGDGHARETMVRPGFANVGDVLKVWMECSDARTRGNNAGALRKWVRAFADGDADNVAITRLTAEELEKYLRGWKGSAEGRKSTGRQILSVFAPRAMSWYRRAGLVLPDMAALRAVELGARRGEARFEGFTVIPEAVLRRMDAAAERLRRHPNKNLRRVWAVYALMRRCGLRNSEVAALRWDWIVKGARNPLWRIEARRLEDGTTFAPKGSAGDVPVRLRTLAELRRAMGTREGFVIPRENKTDAEILTHRTINRFVRRFLPGRQKVSYELRKQFGAEIARRSGLEVASKVLRHSDIKTTWKHYHALLEEPEPL